MGSTTDDRERTEPGQVAVEKESPLHLPSRPRSAREKLIQALAAIPEGFEVHVWPAHSEGPDCWCKPRIVNTPDGKSIWVLHHGPDHGYFDC